MEFRSFNRKIDIYLAAEPPTPYKQVLLFVEGMGWTDGAFSDERPYGYCHKWAWQYKDSPNNGVLCWTPTLPNPEIF